MKSYPQQKRDPEGFYLSIGFIAALVAIGAVADFARHGDVGIGVVGIAAAVAAVVCYRRAKAAR